MAQLRQGEQAGTRVTIKKGIARSATTRHIQEIRHLMKEEDAFLIIFQLNPNCLLNYVKAVAIRRFCHVLWAQKEIIVNMKLRR